MATLQSVLPGCISCCSGSVPAEAGAWTMSSAGQGGQRPSVLPQQLVTPHLVLPPALHHRAQPQFPWLQPMPTPRLPSPSLYLSAAWAALLQPSLCRMLQRGRCCGRAAGTACGNRKLKKPLLEDNGVVVGGRAPAERGIVAHLLCAACGSRAGRHSQAASPVNKIIHP